MRSTGNAANGAAFDPSQSGAGTDYSQSDTPVLTLSDAAAVQNSTTLTSATGGFTSPMIGNYLKIASGVNFVVGYYRITAVASSTSVTLDRAPATAGAGSGGSLRVGGAASGLADVGGAVVAGVTVYIRGTFNSASQITITPSGSDGSPITYLGYAATRGDGGQAQINATAAMTAVVEFDGNWLVVRGLTLNGGGFSAFAAYGLYCTGQALHVDNCKAFGCTQIGIYFPSTAFNVTGTRLLGNGNGTTASHAGIRCDGSGFFDRCCARNNGGSGFAATINLVSFVNCLSFGNGPSGFYVAGGVDVRLISCTSYGNAGDGLRFASGDALDGVLVRNCIFAGNGGYGINSTVTNYSGETVLSFAFENNAYYNNLSGAQHWVPAGLGDITLTANPFNNPVNDATSDFGLNTAPGGGLLVRGAGVPGGFGLRTNPEVSAGISDVGAVPGNAPSALGSVLSLWREYTNERNLTVVPDATVDQYLDDALQALNRRAQYHWTTDSTTLALVAGQQELTLPADFLEVAWVEWAGRTLSKSDYERWRSQNLSWRNEPAGEPLEFAIYANKLILRPAPSAEAVAASATLTIRYNSTPGAIATFGPDQLATQDYRPVVYRAVAVWAFSQPGGAEGQYTRAQEMNRMFEEEAAKIKVYYADRRVAR